ncbi:MAG TPA: kelch repeat-containing protein [Puia sp.]|nr:kelch repeat-containing protein [Puia sp.]
MSGKRLLLFAFMLHLFSCSKNNSATDPVTVDPPALPVITGFSPLAAQVDSIVTITGAHFNPDISKDVIRFNGTIAVVKSGTDAQLIVIVPAGASTGKITVTIDAGTATSGEIFTVLVHDQWTVKSSFPGSFMGKITSFRIGNKLYAGIGQAYTGNLQEFWQYDATTGAWTQKASYPAMSLPGLGIGFSIGNKGYVIMSPDSLGYTDLWQYDTALNTWTKRAYFPGSLKQGMTAFSINNFGYVGLGGDGIGRSNKIWQYDPVADSWAPKSDFPGTGSTNSASFVVGSYAYVGTGMNGFNTITGSTEFYRYDPSTDTWTKKADFPGVGRNSAAGFAIGDYGYLGTGYNLSGFYLSDFWQYNPSTDIWAQKNDFGGGVRGEASGFAGDNQGYLGFGSGAAHQAGAMAGYNSIYIDLWEYQP